MKEGVDVEKISIIVPVYNVDSYLRPCLESVLAQTHQTIEVILVDDGSTDTSGEICDEYKAIDNRIKVVHKRNGGLSSARNEGLKYSTGQYIGFVDSDDVINPDMFLILYEQLKSYHAEIAVCNMCYDKKKLGETNSDKIEVMDTAKALGCLSIAKPFGSHACNKLFDAKLIGNIRFPENKTYEDLYTIYKWIARAHKIVYIDRNLYFYRSNPQGITKLKFSKSNMNIIYGNLELLVYMRENYTHNVKYVRMSLAKASVALLRKISLDAECDEYRKYVTDLQEYLRKNLLFLLIGPYKISSKVFGIFVAVNFTVAKSIYRKLETLY